MVCLGIILFFIFDYKKLIVVKLYRMFKVIVM